MAQNNKSELQSIDIRVFYQGGRGGGGGWASRMMTELQPDVPVLVSDYAPEGSKPDSVASTISQAAKRAGIKVAIRTLDGKQVAMRLRDPSAA